MTFETGTEGLNRRKACQQDPDRRGTENMLARFSAMALAAALLLPVGARAAEGPGQGPDAVGPGYDYYRIGDIAAPTPGKTGPLLALMGGGDWPLEAFRQFVKQSGGGHIVVLRARGGRDLQD